MTDLVEFVAWLRHQIDEDERVARAANTEEIHWLAEYGASTTSDDSEAHIKRHDPARVLAEVAAKKAILELHVPRELNFVRIPPGTGKDEAKRIFNETPKRVICSVCMEGLRPVDHPCRTVRLLAQPFAGRPSWREEWAT
jgi:hypothetical protein